MRSLDLTDPQPPGEQVKLLVTRGTPENWGELELLRGTSWEAGVGIISSEALSNTLHGYFLPLLRELGREPRASGKRVLEREGTCLLKGTCLMWSEPLCRPGGRLRTEWGPPGCYEPPLIRGSSQEARELFREVSQAWKENRYTLVVVGENFNLR